GRVGAGLVPDRSLDARGSGLLAARVRGARSGRGAARRADLDRVLDRVRFSYDDDGLVRARAASPSRAAGVRVSRACARDVAAGRARALLPRHDRDRDEHDRRLRLHRRDHDRARRDLAPAGPARRGDSPARLAARPLDLRGVRDRARARRPERRGPVARPRLDRHAHAARSGRDRAARARAAAVALDAGRHARAVPDLAALGAEAAPLARGILPVVRRTDLRRAPRLAARVRAGLGPFPKEETVMVTGLALIAVLAAGDSLAPSDTLHRV